MATLPWSSFPPENSGDLFECVFFGIEADGDPCVGIDFFAVAKVEDVFVVGLVVGVWLVVCWVSGAL